MISVAADMVTVPLRYRLPDNVVSIIQPLLEPDERVVASPDGLIVMAESERINALRELIEQLDTRPVQYVVTVLQSDTLTAERLNLQGGLDARLPVDSRSTGSIRINGRIAHEDSVQDNALRQTLNILEGHAAVIEIGTQRPVPGYRTNRYYPESATFRSVTSGFEVVPRRLGDCRVRLQVSPWSMQDGNRLDDVYHVQSAQTVIEVKHGEWFELARSNVDRNREQTRVFGYRDHSSQRRSRVLLKIDADQDC